MRVTVQCMFLCVFCVIKIGQSFACVAMYGACSLCVVLSAGHAPEI